MAGKKKKRVTNVKKEVEGESETRGSIGSPDKNNESNR
tara:strand:+ start:3970 stop:4083 length:114 start_codon:yes stop_codon:yes gene_type:complete